MGRSPLNLPIFILFMVLYLVNGDGLSLVSVQVNTRVGSSSVHMDVYRNQACISSMLVQNGTQGLVRDQYCASFDDETWNGPTFLTVEMHHIQNHLLLGLVLFSILVIGVRCCCMCGAASSENANWSGCLQVVGIFWEALALVPSCMYLQLAWKRLDGQVIPDLRDLISNT